MEGLSHSAAHHHVSRVLFGTHLPESRAWLWEMAIKVNLGRLSVDLTALEEQVQAEGFQWLAISNEHLLEVARLETIEGHRDPFDRLLVAQSRVEPLLLLTCDRALRAYGSCVRLIS